MDFKDCQLIDPIVKALEEQGYTRPTAIQAGAIPPALKGRDVLGCARTGTGKTCAFAAPILQRLSQTTVEGRPVRALVLTPTRELAIQNQTCFEAYGKYLNLNSVVVFGGVGQAPQVQAIQQGADILVATPGRLADLYQQGYIDLSRLEIFVLDEADRMLDMGFIHDVKKILKWLPQRKQTLFFSATMPEEITQLVNSLLYKPVRVAVDPVNSAVDAIRQQVYQVDRSNKTKLLVSLLEDQSLSSVLVFTRTKHGANKVSNDLKKAGISSAAIHGNKSQTARQEALAGFKEGKLRVLVATDIAARGLDIEELACVVNYNLPEVPETYVHRIGRTGRAGRGGIAIALCDYNELPLLKEIEKLMGKQIPVVEGHPWPMENFEAAVRDRSGKIRNPEDEEARAAARERMKERRAAAKAAQQEPAVEQAPKKGADHAKKRKKQNQPADGGVQKTQSAPAPEKTAKKGKKTAKQEPTSGVIPIPDLLPKREEKPVEPARPFDSNDILHRKYKKPEKKVIPSLSSVSLLPNVELKETFNSRRQMLMERMGDIPGEDATTRMFSGKKEIPEPFRPGKKDGQKEQAEKQGNPSGEKKKPGKKKKEQKQGAKQPKQAPKASAKRERPVRKEAASPAKGLPGKKAHVPPRFERPTRQKDSTEQKTLMKPYYLSDMKKERGRRDT